RQKALTKIPPITPRSTPDELAAHRHALTETIVAYRHDKKRGEIFKPDVEAAIRRTLQREFAGPNGPAIALDLKQGNPKVEGNPLRQDPSKESRRPVIVAV